MSQNLKTFQPSRLIEKMSVQDPPVAHKTCQSSKGDNSSILKLLIKQNSPLVQIKSKVA